MKPLDDNRQELDAAYSIELQPGGFDLIVESRGGSNHGPNSSRSPDYNPALRLHLERMKQAGMTLAEIQVASRPVMKIPEADRRIEPDGYPFPLLLAGVRDVEDLRLAIGRASAAFGRSASSGGSSVKRLRLRISWSGSAGMSVDAIETFLARPFCPALPYETPTANPDELADRVAKMSAHIRAARKRGPVLPPPGQKTVPRMAGTASRFVRDPNVIAWVLSEAAGNCEICARPAPFLGLNGEPFLEVHHVRPLGEGGPDTTDNAVACCPNCHRQLHHDPDRIRLRYVVIAGIDRLNDYS